MKKKITCLVIDDEEMSRATIEHFVKQTDTLELVGVCADAIEAGNILREQRVDLLFLDVEMPKMNGLDLIKSLAHAPEVILVTSKKNYAVEAFENDVLDYLVKPVEYSRFLKAYNKAQDKLEVIPVEHRLENNEVFIKSDSKLVKINYQNILYIEALADYATIHLKGAKHIIHSTMKKLENKLPSEDFIRVHRSFLSLIHI